MSVAALTIASPWVVALTSVVGSGRASASMTLGLGCPSWRRNLCWALYKRQWRRICRPLGTLTTEREFTTNASTSIEAATVGSKHPSAGTPVEQVMTSEAASSSSIG
jgi:hypothetical protein